MPLLPEQGPGVPVIARTQQLDDVASAAPSGELGWLILGGGVHGVHLAVRLLTEGGVAPERLAIVEPGARLLERWRACTAVTGMTHLRSPAVHNLDTDAFSLLRFARKRRSNARGQFAPPYDRPSLELFHAHAEHVMQRHELAARHVRDRVVGLSVERERVVARLGGGVTLVARDAILALGAAEQPRWPDWAPRDHERVGHVFARDGHCWPPTDRRRVAVVGGGISAAQVALRLADEGRQVELFSRHALRERQFDSEPGWFGPKFLTGFARLRDAAERRAVIDEVRHTGSMPPDVHRALRRALRDERIRLRRGEVASLEEHGDALRVQRANGSPREVDHVLLATGFASRRPGGRLLDELVEQAALPCAPCGYPILDTRLRWHPRLRVSGPLAELEIGPVARTIAGARLAGDRILAS